MFGRQVFDERLCEKLTCLPVHGSLPQTSHLYAMFGNPPEALAKIAPHAQIPIEIANHAKRFDNRRLEECEQDRLPVIFDS
jgi:hypothetical protein